MDEYGASGPNDETRPIEGELPQQPVAPTWQWTGTQPSGVAPYGGYVPPMPLAASALPPAAVSGGSISALSRRTRGLGVAAAVLLVGGAAAGGAAFGYAHGHDGASATGIASGGTGTGSGSSGGGGTSPTVPGQSPSTQAPPTGGNGHVPGSRRGGRASSFIPPGHATAAQQVGVVDINTKLKYQVAKAAGTGMILSADGEILTNNHVVEGATKIKVTVVATGKTYVATVVGTDKVDDVAVLQLTGASGLTPITQDTDGVHVGDAVTAVGNAMGLGGIPSAAKGSIIGLNRSITTQSEAGVDGERLTGMIQVDAQVISGDSGGPLYDTQGEVIGMDTAASSSPSQSLGFAIPIAKAMAIADRMESGQAGGNITLGVPGFLGIQYQSGSKGGSGALVTGVVPKAPAAGLGLLPGDTITRVGGTAVTSGDQLKTLLAEHRGGDSISLTWTDSKGGLHTQSVTLIDGPAE